jgi:hypothetical protein
VASGLVWVFALYAAAWGTGLPSSPSSCSTCDQAARLLLLVSTRAGGQPGAAVRECRARGGAGASQCRGPLVFSSTERFRKKSKRRSKGLGEKRPNPGCFWFTAVGGRFFWRRKNFRGASLGSEWQKMAHTKLILCVSNKLFYHSGYAAPEMQYWQANIFQTTRAGAWPV